MDLFVGPFDPVEMGLSEVGYTKKKENATPRVTAELTINRSQMLLSAATFFSVRLRRPYAPISVV